MSKVLACRVLANELRHLRPALNPDYFEPLCHRLQPPKFVAYVDSLIRDHSLLVCGDCGGLASMARRRRIRLLPAKDCIDLLVRERQTGTLYLTDGWLGNLDRIFGLERLDGRARPKVLRTLLSSVGRMVYVSTPGGSRGERRARALASILGCQFGRIEGSLDGLSEGLKEAGA